MQKMVELAKKMAARDTAFSHLLLFMLKLCRHWFCEVLVTVLEIAIGIMTAYTYFGVLLWVVCALLVLLMIGSGLCKAYDLCVKANREDEVATLREENKLLLMAKNSATDLNGKAAKYIYRMERKIKHEGWVSSLSEMRNVYGFQRMAFEACDEIYNLLQAKFGLNGHWVTIYQRFEDSSGKGKKKKKDYCKMIAYANATKQEPMTYQDEYEIPKRSANTQSIELHTKIFASSDVSPRILMTKDDVMKEFVIHEKSRNREEKIQQYIALPVKVCNREITFIIQIDCDVENGMGKNFEEVQALVNDVLLQYAILLSLHYEIDRFDEVSTKSVEKMKVKMAREGKNAIEKQAS